LFFLFSILFIFSVSFADFKELIIETADLTARKVLAEAVPEESFEIKPSSECNTEKSPWFASFLSDLRISPAKATGWEPDWEVSIVAPVKFQFIWESKTESTAYEPLCKYLNSIGLVSSVIGNGQDLPDGYLFKSFLYATRKTVVEGKLGGTQPEPILPCLGRIQGLSDIAVWAKDPKDAGVGSGNFAFFLEIKAPGAPRDRAIRETILQVIGINARNCSTSPPVILSNLAEMNYIFYLDHNFEADPYLYRLCMLSSKSLDAAVHYVRTVLLDEGGFRKGRTEYLGRRRITPQSSPVKGNIHLNEDDDEEEEEKEDDGEFDRVQFSPVKPAKDDTERLSLAVKDIDIDA
jgi:hypothetical protein